MRHEQGLFRAIRYFGSENALGKAIGVSQQTVSYWTNYAKQIPYQNVLLIEAATNSCITRYDLAPNEAKINQIVKQLGKVSTYETSKIALDDIKISDPLIITQQLDSSVLARNWQYFYQQRPLLIDTQFNLISHSHWLDVLKEKNNKNTDVWTFNLMNLIELMPDVDVFNLPLYASERLALALALEKHIDKLAEQPNKIESQDIKYIIKHKYDYIPTCLNIGSKSHYDKLKVIMQQGVAPLVVLLDQQHLNIKKAHELAELSPATQYDVIKEKYQETLNDKAIFVPSRLKKKRQNKTSIEQYELPF